MSEEGWSLVVVSTYHKLSQMVRLAMLVFRFVYYLFYVSIRLYIKGKDLQYTSAREIVFRNVYHAVLGHDTFVH